MTGIERIAKERQRQLEVEGWTPEHDDEHSDGELALAAVCYAAPGLVYTRQDFADQITFTDPWPFEPYWDKRLCNGNVTLSNQQLKPEQRIRMLEKAGALIAAEIDRLLREASQ